MKYLMMLVISLGLVGCGGSSDSSSKGSDAVEKWAKVNNSRAGDYSLNRMSYFVNTDTRTLDYGRETIAQQTEEEIEKLREEATDLTDNSYCFTATDHAQSKIKINRCRYIDNADSSFEEQEWLFDTPHFEEYVYINSVKSISTFYWSSAGVQIASMNLKTSTTYDDGDESEDNNIVGEWTFKTYTFNDNKLISLKSTTSKATCTANECTEINLTGLTYQEFTYVKGDQTYKANTWSGSQGENTAEVVMSPDQKQLSIMICEDFAKIKSLTECSFIAGTRVEKEGEAGT